ncbi:MAG: putative manganese transporter [Lachnospiraceae bacterium]|nr:putative manganese transporter [Lachnospiraceae bacterium]
MELIIEVLHHTISESILMLPFLFVAFLILEALEHYSTPVMSRLLTKINKAGPLAGALFGCVPQCGFSVMATNLYAGGIASLGTLLAVYLSTSDEAVLLMLAHPGREKDILWLLSIKILIAVIAGYLTDVFLAPKIVTPKAIGNMCSDCGCHEHHGILKPAVRHTIQVFGFLLLFSGVLNLLIEAVGLDGISRCLLQGSILQPFFAALIGLIPNCASSVLLTELYLSGALSFASVIAGLCTNAGVGLVVLFRVNRNRKENMKILGFLYAIAVAAGVILSIVIA